MRTIGLAGFGLLLAALGAATTATRAAGAADLSVELSNGLLSLRAEDVPLRAILDEIARVTDVRIRATDGAAPAGDETPTTLVLADVRVDATVATTTRVDPQIRVVQMGDNVGFARACNAGVRAASHDHVLLMNPDVALLHAERTGDSG